MLRCAGVAKTGIRMGLKIPGSERTVWVRIPSPAPPSTVNDPAAPARAGHSMLKPILRPECVAIEYLKLNTSINEAFQNATATRVPIRPSCVMPAHRQCHTAASSRRPHAMLPIDRQCARADRTTRLRQPARRVQRRQLLVGDH